MNDFTKMYEYYKSLDELERYVFIDVINDLIGCIKVIDKIKNSNFDEQQKKIISDLIIHFKEVGINEMSGFFMYKKMDYTKNKEISNLVNINDSGNISKFALLRRKSILTLIRNNIIEDLKVGNDTLFPENELIKDKFISINENGVKKFNFDSFKIKDNYIIFLGEKFEINEKNILLLSICKSIEEFKNFYGEDQLNKELNFDDSHKQILSYKADKKILSEILFKLRKDSDKNIIESYEFIENIFYINSKEFKINNSPKTAYFLELLSKYFYTKRIKKVSISEFNDFYNENNTKEIKYLTLDLNNIKNNYLKTIRKHIGNKYINNEILYIEKDFIKAK